MIGRVYNKIFILLVDRLLLFFSTIKLIYFQMTKQKKTSICLSYQIEKKK
jgi:hypothetical protein